MKFRTLLLILTLATEVFSTKSNDHILDAYFFAVTTHSVENVLDCFHTDAVVQSPLKTYTGQQEIRDFYENGLLRCKKFYPTPKKRIAYKDTIAVEIGLNCDGRIAWVGDFFTFAEGKISRLNIYEGQKFPDVK